MSRAEFVETRRTALRNTLKGVTLVAPAVLVVGAAPGAIAVSSIGIGAGLILEEHVNDALDSWAETDQLRDSKVTTFLKYGHTKWDGEKHVPQDLWRDSLDLVGFVNIWLEKTTRTLVERAIGWVVPWSNSKSLGQRIWSEAFKEITISPGVDMLTYGMKSVNLKNKELVLEIKLDDVPKNMVLPRRITTTLPKQHHVYVGNTYQIESVRFPVNRASPTIVLRHQPSAESNPTPNESFEVETSNDTSWSGSVLDQPFNAFIREQTLAEERAEACLANPMTCLD